MARKKEREPPKGGEKWENAATWIVAVSGLIATLIMAMK
jgi:hypothetical protein